MLAWSNTVKVNNIHRRGYMFKDAKRINEDVIDLIKKRLAAGAEKYGEEILVDDKRDMIQETLEELLDSCVYLACKIIQLQRKEKKDDTRS